MTRRCFEVILFVLCAAPFVTVSCGRAAAPVGSTAVKNPAVVPGEETLVRARPNNLIHVGIAGMPGFTPEPVCRHGVLGVKILVPCPAAYAVKALQQPLPSHAADDDVGDVS